MFKTEHNIEQRELILDRECLGFIMDGLFTGLPLGTLTALGNCVKLKFNEGE